jgi:hypothetical protein
MDVQRVLLRAPEVVEADVDGERVLLSPKDLAYFGLEGTGAVIWDRIAEPIRLGELVDQLTAEYQADPELIRAEVVDFAAGLEAAGLLAEVTPS